jgi:hypothetical protein
MTPSKSEERRHKAQTETQDMQPEQDFNFPSVGLTGVTIRAKDRAEAEEKLKKLQADIAKGEKAEKPSEVESVEE